MIIIYLVRENIYYEKCLKLEKIFMKVDWIKRVKGRDLYYINICLLVKM